MEATSWANYGLGVRKAAGGNGDFWKELRKEDIMKGLKERTELISRRRILTGSAVLLAGGIVGRISNAVGAPKPSADKAPPLPWKWFKLDPLEAGRRAYRNYLTNKG